MASSHLALADWAWFAAMCKAAESLLPYHHGSCKAALHVLALVTMPSSIASSGVALSLKNLNETLTCTPAPGALLMA